MKKIAKGLVLVLALAMAVGLVLSLAPAANAAVLILEPNETTTFTIEYSDAWGVDGTIEFSDPSVISKVTFDTAGSGMVGLAENGSFFFYTETPKGVNGKIVIRVTLAGNVPSGASTSVLIRYNVTAAESTTPGKTQTISTTLMAQQSIPTPPPVEGKVNVTDLINQMKIAQGLNSVDYTPESWKAVKSTMELALNALASNNQAQVDNANANLRFAINTLVPMDYSQLQSALDGLSTLEELEQIAPQWERFVLAVNNANALLRGGDAQEAVNAALVELQVSKEELLAALAELGETVEVEVEVEKIVEKIVTETVYVQEEGECTKWVHKLYFVLMLVSLAINVVLATLIIIHLIKKRRAHRDKTPLVEYNIEDDGTPNR